MSGSGPDDHTLPAPTVWPMVFAFGLTLGMAALVTHVVVGIVGLALALIGGIGWWFQVLPEEQVEHVPVRPLAERATPVVAASTSVEHLQLGEAGHRVRLPVEVQPLSAGLKGGLVGAVVMAVVALGYGVFVQRSPWYPINLLAGIAMPTMAQASIDLLRTFSAPALVLGTIAHGVVSVLVGLLYAAMLPMLPRRHTLWGGLIAPLLWTGLLWALLGVINPTVSARIDWTWFVASQIAFGLGSWSSALSPLRPSRPGLRCVRASTSLGRSGERAVIAPRGTLAVGLMLVASVAGWQTPCRAGRARDAGGSCLPRSSPSTPHARHCAVSAPRDAWGPRGLLNDPLYLALVPRERLRHVIARGVPGTSQPAFAQSAGGELTDVQIDALVQGLIATWGRPDAARDATLPPYDSAPGDAERGRAVYAVACAACHGPEGRGGPKGGAVVDASYLALVSDQGLRATVIAGRPDLGMPDWRGYVAGQPLTRQQIADIVAWLVGQRRPVPGVLTTDADPRRLAR
jgi:mono/diheme cytochrome c family protein